MTAVMLVKSTKATELVGYDVMRDGVLVGRVMRVMFTRERRTPGKRYVNARWQSPGWTFKTPDVHWSYRREVGTRRDAIRNVLEHGGAAYFDAVEASKAAKVSKP